MAQRVSGNPVREWMLVAPPPVTPLPGGTGDSPEAGGSLEPSAAWSKRSVLLAVARRGLPNIIEATIIPAILFFVIVSTIGAGVAMAVVLAWGYGAVARRLLWHKRVPTVLVLATVGLTVKTTVGLLLASTFAYFLQPVATASALAGVFLASVLVGRPVVARLAHDFCPIAPEVATRPAVVRLFAGLTVLWAGVHLLTAAATFGMLVSLPVPLFVILKTASGLGITAAAIVITVSWALRTARSEQLQFAVA
jgi:hypothetical protein